VIRTWTVLVLLATGLATQAADAAVIQGTRPPSRADRKGLVRAFDALHRNRSHLRLVGFRVWENKPAGAAYSLTTDAQGKYVAGHTDLFRRLSGHRWKHTSHFKNENPLFNWASTLHPGYLYRATSDGTGAYDEQSRAATTMGRARPATTCTPTSAGTSTSTTAARFYRAATTSSTRRGSPARCPTRSPAPSTSASSAC
jgi:hypothetical protein